MGLEERRAELAKANRDAWAWLCGAGNFLTTAERQHIVEETISCYGMCRYCLDMRSTCFRDETTVVPLDGSHGLEGVLDELVHWTANLQKLASRPGPWLDVFLAALSARYPTVTSPIDIMSIYCEIVTVTSFVCGLKSLHDAWGAELPPIPPIHSISNAEPKRLSLVDLEAVLSEEGEHFGHLPWIKSLKVERLPPGLTINFGVGFSPLSKVRLAAWDVFFFELWEKIVYMDGPRVMNPFAELPPHRALSRHEIETVATEVARTAECVF